MHLSEIEQLHQEVVRQKRDEEYSSRYWLMVHACILLQPNLKEGAKVKPEDFIGPAPWETPTPKEPEETDEELVALAERKGLRGPRI